MIHERSQARRIALQGLYQLDVQGDQYLNHDLKSFVDQATEDARILRDRLFYEGKSAWTFRATTDRMDRPHRPREWPVYRMAVVDRNILRLAVWELTNYSATPARVVPGWKPSRSRRNFPRRIRGGEISSMGFSMPF